MRLVAFRKRLNVLKNEGRNLIKIAGKLSFMKQNRVKSEYNIYRNWVECSDGSFSIIHDLCQEIADRYAEDVLSIDIVIGQIKEKFATLRSLLFI